MTLLEFFHIPILNTLNKSLIILSPVSCTVVIYLKLCLFGKKSFNCSMLLSLTTICSSFPVNELQFNVTVPLNQLSFDIISKECRHIWYNYGDHH